MKIGIIGTGKVGCSIAHVLLEKGFRVSYVSDIKGGESFRFARRYIGKKARYTEDNIEVATAVDVIAITTQDRQIDSIVKEIDESGITLENKVIFHTSGADPSSILSPLDKKGAIIGSLHPLQTFPDVESAIEVLPDTFIFIEGDERAIPVLTEIGEAIGRSVQRIRAGDKVLYHLSAVFVCNLLCALYYSGEEIMEKIGVAFESFFPIIRATMQNIERKGPLSSLTGPVIRGDTRTVHAHIENMRSMDAQRSIYKSLSRVALEMAKARGAVDREAYNSLKKLLDNDNDRKGIKET